MLNCAPVLANSGGPKQWSIGRTVASGYRITFMTASGDNEGTNYSLSVNDGSGAKNSSYTHTANGVAYHVFDVSSGFTPITLDVTSAGQNRQISGIAFDALPIPEPTAAMLAGVAGLGLIRRRRRRAAASA